MTAKPIQGVVRVRVPDRQAPFVVIDGYPHVSLLWHFGDELDVPIAELAALLADSRGSIVIARRLTDAERRTFEEGRYDMDGELHARIVNNERMRWRRAR